MRYLGPILSLTLVIAIHELGHVAVAALLGIKLERFSIGLGPALLSGRRRGTQLVLGAIPIGAFAQIRGMNPHAVNFDRRDPRSFASKSGWTRALIIAAGSLANFALTLCVLTGLYFSGTHVPIAMTIGTVAPGSEAAKAQLRPGDVVIAIDGRPVTQWSQFVDLIADRSGEVVSVRVLREQKTLEVQVRPRSDERGRGRIGLSQQYAHRRHRLSEALRDSLSHSRSLIVEGVHLLRRLARENIAAEMVQQMSAASVSGIDSWLRAIAALSLALGLFHLLPFPPLDGGRMVLLALEGLSGQAIHPKLESVLHAVGTLVLIAVLGWLLARDVARLLLDGKSAESEPAFIAGPPPDGGEGRTDAGGNVGAP